MDYSLGALAILKQQEMLREARQRNRIPESRNSRQREAKLAFRRLTGR